jgi:predicted  nucleic acid-binding Zn-ribbon protein
MQNLKIHAKFPSAELICLFPQECNNARTKIFKNLLLDHNKLKKSHRTLLSTKEQSEKNYAAKLKTAEDEIARLQQELSRANEAKTAAENAMKAKTKAAEEQTEIVKTLESRATSAEAELTSLRATSKSWLSELTRINSQMDSKFLFFFFLLSADLHFVPPYD